MLAKTELSDITIPLAVGSLVIFGASIALGYTTHYPYALPLFAVSILGSMLAFLFSAVALVSSKNKRKAFIGLLLALGPAAIGVFLSQLHLA